MLVSGVAGGEVTHRTSFCCGGFFWPTRFTVLAWIGFSSLEHTKSDKKKPQLSAHLCKTRHWISTIFASSFARTWLNNGLIKGVSRFWLSQITPDHDCVLPRVYILRYHPLKHQKQQPVGITQSLLLALISSAFRPVLASYTGLC